MIIREASSNDLPAILNLFEWSIRTTCKSHYNPQQIEAWVSSRNNRDRWLSKITEQYFIVAEVNGELAGFSSLQDDYLDFMFVHPEFQERGIAKRLMSEILSKAKDQGVLRVFSNVSITARPFFEKHDFEVIRTNHNELQGVVLVNFRMERSLASNHKTT